MRRNPLRILRAHVRLRLARGVQRQRDVTITMKKFDADRRRVDPEEARRPTQRFSRVVPPEVKTPVTLEVMVADLSKDARYDGWEDPPSDSRRPTWRP